MEQSKGRRVVFFPIPAQGHINPMLELANILHAKGFSIAIIYANINSLNPSTLNRHFIYHSIPVDLTENEASIKDPTLRLSILNAKCVEPFRECLAGLLSDDVKLEDPVACLISDTLLPFTRSIAESFKLPRILLHVSCTINLVVWAVFPLLKEKGYLPIQGISVGECFLDDERTAPREVWRRLRAAVGLLLHCRALSGKSRRANPYRARFIGQGSSGKAEREGQS